MSAFERVIRGYSINWDNVIRIMTISFGFMHDGAAVMEWTFRLGASSAVCSPAGVILDRFRSPYRA